MPLLLQHASTSKSWALSGDAAEDISPQPLTYKVEIFTGDVRGAGTHVSPLTGIKYLEGRTNPECKVHWPLHNAREAAGAECALNITCRHQLPYS